VLSWEERGSGGEYAPFFTLGERERKKKRGGMIP